MDFFLGSAGLPQIIDGLLVDWEETDSRTVLWRHIADSRSIGKTEALDSRSEELDKLVDDSFLPEHLGAKKDQVSGSRSLLELSSQLEANNLRQYHRSALPQHHSLRLNSSDAPTNHSKAVDHSRV